MHLMVFRMYLQAMQELYDMTEQEIINKTAEEYEDALDTLATMRAHMAYTRSLIKEFEAIDDGMD